LFTSASAPTDGEHGDGDDADGSRRDLHAGLGKDQARQPARATHQLGGAEPHDEEEAEIPERQEAKVPHRCGLEVLPEPEQETEDRREHDHHERRSRLSASSQHDGNERDHREQRRARPHVLEPVPRPWTAHTEWQVRGEEVFRVFGDRVVAHVGGEADGLDQRQGPDRGEQRTHSADRDGAAEVAERPRRQPDDDGTDDRKDAHHQVAHHRRGEEQDGDPWAAARPQ
jgi:hypothetical protein